MADGQVVLTIPWADLGQESRLFTTAQAYARVPIIFRAIHLRASTLTRVPYVILDDSDKELETYIFEDSLPMHDLLYNSELSLLLEGWAFNLKLKNGMQSTKDGHEFIRELQWLNPYTMNSVLIGNEMLFWQQTTSGGRYPKEQTYWNAEDFLYFREFNPIDDLGQGVSATHVVLNDAQINASVTRFLGNFFTADALPLTLVMLNKNTKSDERDRVQGWFSDRLRRLKNAVARVLAVTDDVKVEKLTSELKSFEFEKIDEHVLNAVSNAYQIPKSVLDSRADSYATAQVGMASFINNTVVPRAMYFQEGINKLLKDFGQRIKFRPEEMSENQVDETERASSMAQMVTAGMPLLAALDILGYDLSPEAERIIKQGIEKKVKPTNGAAAPPYVDTGNNVLF